MSIAFIAFAIVVSFVSTLVAIAILYRGNKAFAAHTVRQDALQHAVWAGICYGAYALGWTTLTSALVWFTLVGAAVAVAYSAWIAYSNTEFAQNMRRLIAMVH